MASAWARLRSVIGRHPVLTNMITCGALYGSGDISQQTIRKFEKYDLKNSCRVAAVAFLMFGPIYFYWYKVLDRLIVGRTARHIVAKVAMDQGLISPPCICIFYIGTSILEGKADKFAELKDKGMKTFIMGSVYWPTIQTINFVFLPTHLRTVYVAFGAFVWTNVLCYIKSEGSEVNTHKADSEQLNIK